ncbi:uncharacterized protein LOC144571400 isoform X3 [Carex rostrata]
MLFCKTLDSSLLELSSSLFSVLSQYEAANGGDGFAHAIAQCSVMSTVEVTAGDRCFGPVKVAITGYALPVEPCSLISLSVSLIFPSSKMV